MGRTKTKAAKQRAKGVYLSLMQPQNQIDPLGQSNNKVKQVVQANIEEESKEGKID